MTIDRKQMSATLVVGVLVSFGLVQAQVASGSSLPGTSLAKTEAESEADAEAPRDLQTILVEARETMDRIAASADNISRQLREAREDKDVVKTLCLDDKLNQMNVASRSVADRVASIEAAAPSGNLERIRHDDAVLGALAMRAKELVTEANQCIGEESGVLGKTDLKITVDPSIPNASSAPPGIISIISTPPVAASPTL